MIAKGKEMQEFCQKMHDKMGFVNGRTIDLDLKCDLTNLCLLT